MHSPSVDASPLPLRLNSDTLYNKPPRRTGYPGIHLTCPDLRPLHSPSNLLLAFSLSSSTLFLSSSSSTSCSNPVLPSFSGTPGLLSSSSRFRTGSPSLAASSSSSRSASACSMGSSREGEGIGGGTGRALEPLVGVVTVLVRVVTVWVREEETGVKGEEVERGERVEESPIESGRVDQFPKAEEEETRDGEGAEGEGGTPAEAEAGEVDEEEAPPVSTGVRVRRMPPKNEPSPLVCGGVLVLDGGGTEETVAAAAVERGRRKEVKGAAAALVEGAEGAVVGVMDEEDEEGRDGTEGASVVVGDPDLGAKNELFLALPKKLPNPLASCAAPVFATSTPAKNVVPTAAPFAAGVDVDADVDVEPSPPVSLSFSFFGDAFTDATDSSFSLPGVTVPPCALSLIAPCTPANHSPPALHPLERRSLAGLRFAGSC